MSSDQHTKLLTQEGHAALVGEFEELRRRERPKVVAAVADAAAEGDRSENAEYIYGKKRLREIDRRLKYLSRLLKGARVIDRCTLGGDEVCFGATVTIVDENEEEKAWTIVGEGEADAARGRISHSAPLARALLGKKVGDVTVVQRPAGAIEVEILEITFGG
jgi:transcription elongation factor GreB